MNEMISIKLEVNVGEGDLRKATVFGTPEEIGDSLKAITEVLIKAKSPEEAIRTLSARGLSSVRDTAEERKNLLRQRMEQATRQSAERTQGPAGDSFESMLNDLRRMGVSSRELRKEDLVGLSLLSLLLTAAEIPGGVDLLKQSGHDCANCEDNGNCHLQDRMMTRRGRPN
jgi:hypothetical protein